MTYRQGDVRDVPIQFLHQDDVGRANITGDGVLSGARLLRELGGRSRYSSLEALRDTLDGRGAERGES